MLYDSLEHAEDDMTARLLTEARVEARRSLLALECGPRQGRRAADGGGARGDRRRARPARERRSRATDRDEINAAAEALEALSKPFAERRMDRGIRDALSGLSVEANWKAGWASEEVFAGCRR